MNKAEAKDFLTHYICSCPYGTSPTNCGDDKCKFGMAVRTLCREEPTGEWESLGFVNMKYAWCRCSNCHKTTKIYKDSSNEFCCIADIRKKAVACLYCGAKMKGGEGND